MLLAMAMAVIPVVMMGVAGYAVVTRALYDDIDNQLRTRAQMLIESGSLDANPAKAIEGTAYSDMNAMFYIPGRSKYTANQQGQTLPIGRPEQDVMEGTLWMSLRTVEHQRVLAVHLASGNSLLLSKSLAPTGRCSNGWAPSCSSSAASGSRWPRSPAASSPARGSDRWAG